jgi:site-specific recombinase XerC
MTIAGMSKIIGVTDCLLPELLNSWQIILRSQNKSPATITSYQRAVRLYLEWCERNGHPKEITRAQVQAYTAELIEDGKEANTVRLRQAALRAFTRWLVEEDELTGDPLIGLSAPKIPSKVVKGPHRRPVARTDRRLQGQRLHRPPRPRHRPVDVRDRDKVQRTRESQGDRR